MTDDDVNGAPLQGGAAKGGLLHKDETRQGPEGPGALWAAFRKSSVGREAIKMS